MYLLRSVFAGRKKSDLEVFEIKQQKYDRQPQVRSNSKFSVVHGLRTRGITTYNLIMYRNNRPFTIAHIL
jgi:hypothetical protein